MAKLFLFVVGVAVSLGIASGASQEEITAVRTAIRPFLDECGAEFGITRDQLLAAKAAGTVDTFDPCFYACFFKKIGFIDAKGLFDANVALEKNKKYFKAADDIAKIEQMGKTCSSVNDESVSDGDKACERSKLLLKCFLKEKANFTPFESS
uniref:Odorant-binding protein 3 n=1 Tax=Ectropis obliqua TaxID=248899 RepID=A0A1L2BLC0_ECTOB|nr:odorant-binding protein 3 [Ectropis obliqua]